jgi:signal transduction histidine kinase
VIKSQVGKLVIIEEIKKEEAISAKDIVEEQINKITSLIKGIMNSTKPIRVNLINDNINSILSDYVGTITKYLDKNIVEINMNLDNKIPETQLDRTEIMRIFDNLIKNSQEASRNAKININIKTALKDDQIHMTFEDDGTGISKEKLSSIFDPYFTTKKTGDGIGLSTVYRIVKAHSGSINVESEVGEGTRFFINLPIG